LEEEKLEMERSKDQLEKKLKRTVNENQQLRKKVKEAEVNQMEVDSHNSELQAKIVTL
jgi:hypothetical protein